MFRNKKLRRPMPIFKPEIFETTTDDKELPIAPEHKVEKKSHDHSMDEEKHHKINTGAIHINTSFIPRLEKVDKVARKEPLPPAQPFNMMEKPEPRDERPPFEPMPARPEDVVDFENKEKSGHFKELDFKIEYSDDMLDFFRFNKHEIKQMPAPERKKLMKKGVKTMMRKKKKSGMY